jgi:hypothetical protein
VLDLVAAAPRFRNRKHPSAEKLNDVGQYLRILVNLQNSGK